MEKGTFRRRLSELRANRQLTQAQLAEKAGLLPAAISHFETGFRFPTAATLAKLADALGVTIDYLLGRDQEVQPAGARYKAIFRKVGKLSDEALDELEMFSDLLEKRDGKRRGEQQNSD